MASWIRLEHSIQYVHNSSGGVTNRPTHRSAMFKDRTNRFDRLRRSLRLVTRRNINGVFPRIVKNARKTRRVQYQRSVVALYAWNASVLEALEFSIRVVSSWKESQVKRMSIHCLDQTGNETRWTVKFLTIAMQNVRLSVKRIYILSLRLKERSSSVNVFLSSQQEVLLS